MTVIVHDASDADLRAVQRIYAHEVMHGLATFEESPPSVAELRSRRDAIVREGLPFLVAELAGEVVGYSYARSYRPRSAYRHTIEDSVYVAERHQRKGVGHGLLAALIEACEGGPWRQLVAVIGDSGNTGSIALHERRGFRWAGTLTAVGCKLGQWVDTVLMQRPLGPGSDRLP